MSSLHQTGMIYVSDTKVLKMTHIVKTKIEERQAQPILDALLSKLES